MYFRDGENAEYIPHSKFDCCELPFALRVKCIRSRFFYFDNGTLFAHDNFFFLLANAQNCLVFND